jgi:hypothetical protein
LGAGGTRLAARFCGVGFFSAVPVFGADGTLVDAVPVFGADGTFVDAALVRGAGETFFGGFVSSVVDILTRPWLVVDVAH